MKRSWIICRREWSSAFDSPMAYIFLVAWLVVSLLVLRNDFYEHGQATLRTLFSAADALLLILVPALAMRMWAEEARSGTLQLLLTWPVKLWEVVLGKFLASAGLIALAVLLWLPVAFRVDGIGSLDWGATTAGFVGTWLLGCAYLAVACAAASFTANQVVAYIVALAVCASLYLVGEPVLLRYWPTGSVDIAENLGFGARFHHFEAGLVRWSDVLYYLSWIVVGLYSTHVILMRHRRPGA